MRVVERHSHKQPLALPVLGQQLMRPVRFPIPPVISNREDDLVEVATLLFFGRDVPVDVMHGDTVVYDRVGVLAHGHCPVGVGRLHP